MRQKHNTEVSVIFYILRSNLRIASEAFAMAASWLAMQYIVCFEV